MAFLPLVFVVISPILAVFFAIIFSKPQKPLWVQSMRKSMTSRKAHYPVYYFFLLTLVVETQILKPVLWKQSDFMKKKNVILKVCHQRDIGIAHTNWLGFFLKKFNPNLQFKDICPYFAHTNSAKCCEDYKKTSQSADRFFENCRGYIPGEIQILDPDILITQGDSAKCAIKYGFSQSTTPIEIDSASEYCNYHLIQMNGKEVLWFAPYHPNQRSGYYNRISVPCFGTWAEEAYRRLG